MYEPGPAFISFYAFALQHTELATCEQSYNINVQYSYGNVYADLLIYFIYCFTAQVLKVCRSPGPVCRSPIMQLYMHSYHFKISIISEKNAFIEIDPISSLFHSAI